MRKRLTGAAMLAALCFSATAIGGPITSSDGLSGYQCYNIDVKKLGMTPEDAWSGKGFPPVFQDPSADSKKLGNLTGLVYVAWPLEVENGFVRIVRANGQGAWIARDVIRPLYKEPGSTGGCKLSWDRNRIQYHLDPGAKAWLFPDGHDIPEDKMRR
jgi:hypothetical protein